MNIISSTTSHIHRSPATLNLSSLISSSTTITKSRRRHLSLSLTAHSDMDDGLYMAPPRKPSSSTSTPTPHITTTTKEARTTNERESERKTHKTPLKAHLRHLPHENGTGETSRECNAQDHGENGSDAWVLETAAASVCESGGKGEDEGGIVGEVRDVVVRMLGRCYTLSFMDVGGREREVVSVLVMHMQARFSPAWGHDGRPSTPVLMDNPTRTAMSILTAVGRRKEGKAKPRENYSLREELRNEPHHVFVQPVREWVVQRRDAEAGQDRRRFGGSLCGALVEGGAVGKEGGNELVKGKGNDQGKDGERRKRARERGEICSSDCVDSKYGCGAAETVHYTSRAGSEVEEGDGLIVRKMDLPKRLAERARSGQNTTLEEKTAQRGRRQNRDRPRGMLSEVRTLEEFEGEREDEVLQQRPAPLKEVDQTRTSGTAIFCSRGEGEGREGGG